MRLKLHSNPLHLNEINVALKRLRKTVKGKDPMSMSRSTPKGLPVERGLEQTVCNCREQLQREDVSKKREYVNE